jgi:hypothetical protein
VNFCRCRIRGIEGTEVKNTLTLCPVSEPKMYYVQMVEHGCMVSSSRLPLTYLVLAVWEANPAR